MAQKSIAYIDVSNLKLGIRQSGWGLDFGSFRSWLRDKFKIGKAILFMGYIPKKIPLYEELRNLGYRIVFKPTIISKDGKIKGNVDGELILKIAKDYYERGIPSAVLVSGDGEYHCIVEFLKQKNVPITIISPGKEHFSYLLKKTNVPAVFLGKFKHKLKVKMKRPLDMP